MNKYGVIYARYSPGRNQNEQSIEGQVRDCMEYAEKNGITIIETYADRHLSGKESEHREELQRMLKDAAKKNFSVVVTWKIDRLGRNRTELAVNKLALKKNGVSVCYAKENIPEGPEGIILEGLLESMAEYYSAELSQKIKRGQRESTLKGRVIMRSVLFGYNRTEDLRYEVNEEQAAAVRKIYELYLSGMLQVDIIRYLAANGIKNKRGGKFTYNNIRSILNNRCYIGEYSFGGVVNNECIPPIVDKETFSEVQKRLNEMKKDKPKIAAASKATVPFYLSGKIVCGSCGENYQGESGTGKNGGKHYYYKCHGRKNKNNSCSAQTFKKEWLEDFIIDNTFEDILNPDTIEQIADKVIAYYEASENSYEEKVIIKTLSDCENRIENVLKAIEQGIVNASLQNRLNELELEQRELNESLARIKREKHIITKEHVIYWLNMFSKGDIMDADFKKRFFDSFINSVEIYKENIVIHYNLIDKKKRAFLSKNDIVRLLDSKVDFTMLQSNIMTKIYSYCYK